MLTWNGSYCKEAGIPDKKKRMWPKLHVYSAQALRCPYCSRPPPPLFPPAVLTRAERSAEKIAFMWNVAGDQ